MVRMGEEPMGKRMWATLLTKTPGCAKKLPLPTKTPRVSWRSRAAAVIGKAAPSGKTDGRKPAAALSEAFDVAESSAATHSPPDGPANPGTGSTLH
jgi:hypothetical protein